MTQSALHRLLSECAGERLALLQRHEAAAKTVAHYDFNNTYQYVIAREETHLAWLLAALGEFGASQPAQGAALPAPLVSRAGTKASAPALSRQTVDDDARFLREFLQRWRPRVEGMSNARHRTMLGVVMSESAEHQRLFEQAAAGFEDLLGRRTSASPRVGGVLSTRWVE